MDKAVIFAVAGSGKTTRIVDHLDSARRYLVLTYTMNNQACLRRRICQKFGFMPENITVRTYFAFLNSFCYQPYLLPTLQTKGVTFKTPPDSTSRRSLEDDRRYMDGGRRVFHSRMAKLLDVKGCLPELSRRVERYFDVICIDEVQDFAGHDFNFLTWLCGLRTDVLLVGDFFQHTFDTSRDGAVNKNLHTNYEAYRKRFVAARVRVDTTTLSNSYRCSSSVCEFIRMHLGVQVYPASQRQSTVEVVSDATEALRLYARPDVAKLFYQEHLKYGCFSDNWGSCKGIDHFGDVCVVMNPNTWKAFTSQRLADLSPQTRNKLYVACSRARGNLYIIPDALLRSVKARELLA